MAAPILDGGEIWRCDRGAGNVFPFLSFRGKRRAKKVKKQRV